MVTARRSLARPAQPPLDTARVRPPRRPQALSARCSPVPQRAPPSAGTLSAHRGCGVCGTRRLRSRVESSATPRGGVVADEAASDDDAEVEPPAGGIPWRVLLALLAVYISNQWCRALIYYVNNFDVPTVAADGERRRTNALRRCDGTTVLVGSGRWRTHES
jgi:hypothetical protein